MGRRLMVVLAVLVALGGCGLMQERAARRVGAISPLPPGAPRPQHGGMVYPVSYFCRPVVLV